MVKRYFRMTEVLETCDVSEEFVRHLERENLIKSIKRRRLKLYPLDQVDRIRVAQILVNHLGVNFAGVEVALHMREQLIHMRRERLVFLRRLGRRL
ncbi:MAG: chaperone modulator CbpM [Chloroflexota bacterium]|jgi:MerR family transcriptional regulator/heat shock protein HspR